MVAQGEWEALSEIRELLAQGAKVSYQWPKVSAVSKGDPYYQDDMGKIQAIGSSYHDVISPFLGWVGDGFTGKQGTNAHNRLRMRLSVKEP